MHLVKSTSSPKRNGKHLLFLVLLLLFNALKTEAQNNNEHFFDVDSTRIKDSIAKIKQKPEPTYTYGTFLVGGYGMIISNDFLFNLSIGAQFEKPGIECRANFDFRPFFKVSQEMENDTLIYQYRQKDYMLSLSLEKRFGKIEDEKKLTPYFLLQGGYAFGNYKGWDKNPEPKFYLAGGAGACYSIVYGIHLKLGYLYYKPLTTSAKPHHISLQVLFYFI